jgi:hypothetical protein
MHKYGVGKALILLDKLVGGAGQSQGRVRSQAREMRSNRNKNLPTQYSTVNSPNFEASRF